MRINMPVTTTERFLEPGKPIVTKTDLQGKITYANESFVAISGFTREELLGSDHNIVRHPDMPPQAFADLWRTIRAGQPWRGLVKNRTKGGDFYWVDAFVTPVTQEGRTVGFMSVRTAPSRAAVAAAEALYAQVRAGTARFPETRLPERRIPPAAPWWGLALSAGALAVAAGWLGGAGGIALGGLSAALAATLAAGVRVRILGPLDALVSHVRSLDEGRLGDAVAPPKAAAGSVRAAFTQLEALRIHLRAMFADVLVSAGDIEARSRGVDEALHALIEATREQGDRIAQVAAAMEEMSVSVNEIAQNTAQGLEAAHRTEALAQSGIEVMTASLERSGRVAGVVDTTQQEIAQVDQTVSRIAEVTRIIRDIAEQTNLLALNAAIEAARAGEQGRGFAVVADEVRKLSERTAQSTQHISSGVEDIVRQAHAAVETMATASAEVAASASQIRSSSESLDQIWTASRDAVRAADEIKAMLQQQSVASQEVASAMEKLSGTIEASGRNIQTIGTATGALHATAAEMRALVRHLESALR
jgi:aerotaxis receptor